MFCYCFCDFGPHDLFWWDLSAGEEFADLCSAKVYAFFFVVGAGFLVCYAAAAFAVEEGFEEEGCDA